ETLRPLGDHHLEQSGAWTGEIRVDGRRLAFSGVGSRDHSWGRRDWEALDSSRLFIASFGEDLAAHALAVTVRGKSVEGGYVWRDGRAHRITRIHYVTQREHGALRAFTLRVIPVEGAPL